MHVVSRVVQEGLTNARKHAPGEKVDIEVALERDMVRVTMRNKKLAVATESSGGHGLVGLRERCRLTGGYLEIRDDEDFSWHLYLPLEKQ
ncbi:sensor histidine kinase [Corynebacterium ciconiae]|nr:ATP-binding protein [Corynebacterium ciconiae]